MARMASRDGASGTTKPASFTTGSSDVFKPGGGSPFYKGLVKANTPPPMIAAPPPGTPGVRGSSPAPAPRAPAPIAPRYSAGSPITSSSTGSYSAAAPIAPAPAPPQMSEQDWIAQDSAYITEKGGIDAELANLLEQLKAQRTNYDADFGQGLDNLGWEGDPLGQGSWDRNDTLGAYGQAYKGQTDDFAGRGMLTSSFYGNANEELNNRFNEQRNDMLGGRQRQMSAWDMEQTQGQSRAQQAQAQAMASSYARRAAQYGLG